MSIRDTLASYFGWDEYERPYECLQCGIRLDVEYYVCPKCDSFSIDRRPLTL